MEEDFLFPLDKVLTANSEWFGMPEYNNKDQAPPLIEAKFKFRNKEDYEEFKELVREYLYNNEKVFDGMQSEFKKQAWYPLKEKASKYLVVEE